MKTATQNIPLAEQDKEVLDLLKNEMKRQYTGLEMIASENFTSQAVLEAIGSAFTNKYSEGLPGARYYGGNEFIDELEVLTQNRALSTFHLNPEQWGVNVQPYSGSTANFALYAGVLQPHDRIMGLDLPSGGHLTHGYYTAKKKISATSIFFESFPYQLDRNTGYINYDTLEEQAFVFRPKLIISGGSAYPRDWDYARLRKIADRCGAMLLCDMAHISGIVAAQECNNPFEYCDFVTTTTHKTLRGPRAGMIFFRRGEYTDAKGETKTYDYQDRVNAGVFPSCQGGPHNNTIAGIAVALKEAATPEFKTYIQGVKSNARRLAEDLIKKGYKLITDGTDNHLVLWDLRPQGLTGSKGETILDAVGITVNKNSVVGDTSALTPGGVRIGLAALTSRGMKEDDISKVADFLDAAIKLALEIQKTSGKMLKDFKKGLAESEEVKKMRAEVEAFARQFPMPGFDVSEFN